eukprot:1456647-Lingulodinium_polyedra.AAC.1
MRGLKEGYRREVFIRRLEKEAMQVDSRAWGGAIGNDVPDSTNDLIRQWISEAAAEAWPAEKV